MYVSCHSIHVHTPPFPPFLPPSLPPSLPPIRTRTEELTKRPSTDTVHGARLQIHEDGARDVPPAGCLVEVDVDSLQLQVGVAVVGAGREGGEGGREGRERRE